VALDPIVRAFLTLPQAQFPPVEHLTAEILRAALRQFPAPVLAPSIHATEDLSVAGPAGPLPVRLYRPSAARDLPLIVFFHGGGFVVCDIQVYDDLCRLLATASGCAVASVEYRRAPETRFPGPLEDCYAALKQLAQRAPSLGLDGTRLAVAGDSAGGNLATATALLAREREGPALRYQALIYPALEPACDSASQRAFADGYLLSSAAMSWFWSCYLPSPADAENPHAAPPRAELAGLPAATVVTAEFDPLRDEGEAYADQLRAAGIPVIGRRYLGMIHGFASMPYLTPVAYRALADVGEDLRAALRG
jgi:acetyl esterase